MKEVFFMAKPVIGAQLYTLREFMKTPDDIAASLKKVHDIGFKTVQVSGIGPIDWEHELAGLLRENDLRCVATHVPLDRMLHDTDRLVAEHKAIGSPIMGVGMMPKEYWSEEGCIEFTKVLNEIGRRIAPAGMKVSYHNHNLEFIRTHDGKKNYMDLMIEGANPEYVEFILDTYWIAAGGANPTDYIEKAKGMNHVLHFKDMALDPETRAPIMTECGTGNINFRAVIDVCERLGVPDALIEQDIVRIDPFESLAISYKNLMDIESAL